LVGGVQVTLLEDHTKELKRVIRPGARRLNWNSLGINDYISKCVAVRHFIADPYTVACGNRQKWQR